MTIKQQAEKMSTAFRPQQLQCDTCGDWPSGSPMPKPGSKCGRDLSEEFALPSGALRCEGTYQEVETK